MNASDYIVQQCAKARHEGSVHGLIVGVIVGLGVMLGLHLALSMRADRTHAAAVASIQAADALLLRTCRADVARYEDIRQLERDAVAAMDRREAGR